MGKENSELLKEAIYRDDATAIKRLIKKGVNLEEEYYWMYPIHAACFGGHLKAIRAIAESGGNLDVIDMRERPPLSKAVDNKKIDVVKLLLDLGANPDLKDSTPLHDAPLHIALWRQRSLEAAKLLIEHNADIFAKDWTGNTALCRAVLFKCDECVDLMVEMHGRKAKEAIAQAVKDFGLIESAERNDLDGVKDALTRGANVNAMDPHADFALMQAAGHGNKMLAKLLLDNKADIGLGTDQETKTALMEAAYKGHREMVDLLLDAGADLLEEYIPADHFGGGPDMDAVAFAAEGRHKELYEYLRTLREDLKRQYKKKRKRRRKGQA